MNEGLQKKFQEEIRRPLEQQGYIIQRTLGKGAFGEVFQAVQNGRNWAIKSISKVQVKKRPFLQKYIKQEIEAMHTLKHPNLVCQEKVLETSAYYFMVLEYCDMGNLLTYQSKLKSKTFPLTEAMEILVEVMKGLKLIHQYNYIHRDIKSQNVLIKTTEQGRQFKIADFGFARPMNTGPASTVCGTEKYMAPEILKNQPYNRSVDLWALGILLFFMLFAEYPFKGHDLYADIDRKCRNGFNVREVVSKPDKLKEVTPELEDFFRQLFVIDSRKRISFSALASHPLLQAYHNQFEDTRNFYQASEKKGSGYVYPDAETEDLQEHYQAHEDETRADLLGQQVMLNSGNKTYGKEIQSTSFEIQKLAYIRECGNDIFQNYATILKLEERLAFRYYVLRAFLFYSKSLISRMEEKAMPYEFFEYKLENWGKFASSEDFRLLLNQLREECMKGQIEFEDAYLQAHSRLDRIKIDKFRDKFTSTVDDMDFQSFKLPYRSTTSNIYKRIHQNRQIDSHIKNKLKLRVFCCHMVNRIFDQNELDTNFQWYVKWLATDPRSSQSKYDFSNFKRWVLCESKENLDKNIAKLHKIFFR